MVFKEDIAAALKEVGLSEGETVLFHSSLKSFGYVEGGADSVISAFLDVVTDTGTVLAPTLCQKEFQDAYMTWHINKPSDTGFITEVFRKRPDALRSDQATHSVAAVGKKAEFYTKDHGSDGLRIGIFGYTPFAAVSPWQKLYDDNAMIVFLGVGFESCTIKHLIEYHLVEHVLSLAQKKNEYDKYASLVCRFDTRRWRENYMWPYIKPEKIEEFVIRENLIKTVMCGNSKITAVRAKDFGEMIFKDILNDTKKWYEHYPKALDWLTLNV
ncbi:MAG: AAC(3) family N-acetyltransferase [Ruminococcaceae bacterium]|nr:AAC(3) family N-acetyltransferase [Oscillospiraceae bacterium]